MITLENVSVSYGKNTVIDQVSLTVNPGDVVGIVGENGAGKTTLFNAISGLLPSDGNISVDKNKLGYLETTPYFLKKITGKEYLKLLTKARGLELEITEHENLFDLPLDRYAEQYSTGMKKKLALQAVILQKNESLILDEPFNGVDLSSSLMIFHLIEKLAQARKAIMISSHIFSTLKQVCTVIYKLENGRLSAPIFPDAFDQLEEAMKQQSIGAKLNQLDL